MADEGIVGAIKHLHGNDFDWVIPGLYESIKGGRPQFFETFATHYLTSPAVFVEGYECVAYIEAFGEPGTLDVEFSFADLARRVKLSFLSVSFVDKNGREKFVFNGEVTEYVDDNDYLFVGETVSVDDARSFCEDGQLAIRFRVTVDPKLRRFHPASTATLASDFRKALNDPKHSDIILTCGDRKFHAHRVILSTRSSYFASLFDQAGTEFALDDIGPLNLEAVLEYVYTDNVQNSALLNLELLSVAHMFCLAGLVHQVEMELIKTLLENSFEYLIAAYLCEAKNLKAAAIDHIVDSGYDDLEHLHQYPELNCELYSVQASRLKELK